MNIIIALLPALGWGILPLVVGSIGGSPANQILGTGIGALIMGFVSMAIMGAPHMPWTDALVATASGIGFMIGQIGQYTSIARIGVSRTMPISTGLQLVGTILLSMILFNEWQGIEGLIGGIFSVICLVGGAYATTITDHASEKTVHSIYMTGVMLLLTSIGYWFFMITPKLISDAGPGIFFFQVLGICIGAVIYNLIVHRSSFTHIKSYQSIGIGLLFGVSAICYMYSAKLNGVATGFVLSQLNVVVSTIGGIVLLREKRSKRELFWTGLGLIGIVAGGVISIHL